MPMGLRPKKQLVHDQRDPEFRALYNREFEKHHRARDYVSPLGGLAKRAGDPTRPLGTLAQPLLQYARDEIARTEKLKPSGRRS